MVVAHGETAVAKRARHLCGGRAGGKKGESEREKEKERDVRGGRPEDGQWLGGIWVKRSQPDRRKRGDGGVMWLRRAVGADGRDCLSVVMERETHQRNSEGWEPADFQKTKQQKKQQPL